MISEMMKSSIPSVGGSTREERLASIGPWCSASVLVLVARCLLLPPFLRSVRCDRVARRGDDVLDRTGRVAADALDEVGAQPAGLGLGQRRDDDAV